MMLIRRVVKAMLIFCICLGFLVLGFSVQIGCLPLPQFRSRLRARCMRLWAMLVCRVLGLHVMVAGALRQSAQRGDFFIVSNHISYVDIIVLARVLTVSFLSKHEVKMWPILGWLAYFAGSVFVNRESRNSVMPALQEIAERMAHGVSVVVFPEGTTSDGLRLLEFKSTFFELPVKAGRPVLPIAIRYLSVDGRRIPVDESPPIAWFGDAALASNVWQLLGMRELVVRVGAAEPIFFAESAGVNRKVLAHEARARVAEAYWMPGDR